MTELPRIDLIDYLRGIAALSVAWFHLTNGSEGWLADTGRYGFLGVEAFFVISGLVIPYSIMRAFPAYTLSDYPTFIARRVIRLEPPYLVSIILVLALTLAASLFPQFQGATDGLMDPWRIAAHLFYLIPLTGYEWLQPVYWTLAFEFAFYLSIGILFPVVAGKRQWGSFFLLSAGCWLGVAFLGLPVRILLFVMDFAVFRRLFLDDRGPRNLAILVACLIVMAHAGAWLEGSVGSVVALLLWHHDRLPAFPVTLAKGLSGLGLISYSLYLIHVPVGGRVVNLGKRFIESEWQYLALSLVALLVCFLFAALTYRLVERPAQNFARRVSFGRENVLSPTY